MRWKRHYRLWCKCIKTASACVDHPTHIHADSIANSIANITTYIHAHGCPDIIRASISALVYGLWQLYDNLQ
jgi:hypothetical protein